MGSEIIENHWIYLMWDIASLKSCCSCRQIEQYVVINGNYLSLTATADGVLQWKKKIATLHFGTCGDITFKARKRGKVFSFSFFLLIFFHSLASNQFGFKPKMPLPLSGPADERHQSLFAVGGKKKHAQHFLKLLMFYPIIHRPRTWEYVFVGKPWLDTVEPASLVPVSLGWHVWKLLPQSINKVQVLKYLSRQSFILVVDCLSTLPAP